MPDIPEPALNEQLLTTGQEHERLENLVGRWSVDKQMFAMGGTPEQPLVLEDVVSERQWIPESNHHHIIDNMRGSLQGKPYHRLGVLSYSVPDARYEWNTVDNMNTNMMTYKGEPHADTSQSIEVQGVFTDPGVLGTANVGKQTSQRTVMTIISEDKHIFEMYFTPKGGPEYLIDRSVFTRLN